MQAIVYFGDQEGDEKALQAYFALKRGIIAET
jgi:hypothetical protein